ncbi:MAG: hypothetical protein HYX76_03640 [Acidobacteria bacterium]|nr:hypothetical protein [Acidobacteriota bacterium]
MQSTDGAVLPNMTARLRDLNTGQIVSNTTTDATGKFTFDAAPGGYVVEIVDPGGNIIATSPSIKVTPDCKDVPPLTLIAKGAGGMFWTSKAGVLALVFAGAGVTAGIIAATREPTSPSR